MKLFKWSAAAPVLFGLLAACAPATTPIPLPSATPALMEAALTLPAGAAGLLDIPRFEDWNAEQDGVKSPAWEAHGLPPGAQVEFRQQADDPADAFVIIRSAPETEPGIYALTFSAANQSRTRQVSSVLTVLACSESFSSGTASAQVQTAVLTGGPSSLQYGDSTPIWTFCGSAVHDLRINIVSAMTQSGETVQDYAGVFTLYRLLTWPPDAGTLRLQANLIHSAEPVAISTDGILDWTIESGMYVLVFPQSSLLDGTPAAYTFYPQISVTFSATLQ